MDSKIRVAVAKELIKLAKLIGAAKAKKEPEEEGEEHKEVAKLMLRNKDLQQISTRLQSATGGDITKMLTTVLMALKKAKNPDVPRIFNLFKPLLKKVEDKDKA